MSDKSLVLKWSEKDVFSAVDEVIVDLRQTNNIRKATQILAGLESIEKVSGKAKAKLLFGSAVWWEETGQETKTGDTFLDYIEAETETSKTTATRYIRVWGYIEDLSIPKEVAVRPMRDLVPVANALAQGYEIEKDDWKKLQRAANNSEVLSVLRDIKGKPARKSGLNITLDRKGTLTAWKESKPHPVGFLMIDSDDEVTQKAIQRIIDCAGIQEQ